MNFQTFKDELIKNLKEDRVPTRGFSKCTNIQQLMKVAEIWAEGYDVEDPYVNPLQALNLTVEKLIKEIGFDSYMYPFLQFLKNEMEVGGWDLDLLENVKKAKNYDELRNDEEDILDQAMYRTIEKLITAN